MPRLAAVLLSAVVLCGTGWSFFEDVSVGRELAASANAFVKTLNDTERQTAVHPFDTPKRVDWHFIPKPERKGLQVKTMSQPQREAAFKLLRSALSQVGYDKATRIMSLEKLLKELEAGKGTNIRDPERYFFTLFGKPGEGRWGLSVEGHHLSVNFVIEGDRVVSSSPQAFATNPAIVKTKNNSGIPLETRILDKEETLAFDLVNSLSTEQKPVAVIASDALKEVRNPGLPHPPKEEPAGIAVSKLDDAQKSLLQQLVGVYCESMPPKVAAERLSEIEKAGWDQVHFAWAGATEPGIGHYYRVQGPTFLIEFVNTQPDAAGNIANHIHALWRDMRGDFALPIQ